MPEVSVIIPVFNGSQWVGHALRSVFEQTYRDFEVIVIDDGSTDDLEAALRDWSGRIVFERQPNAGPGSARNHGLRIARGRLVAFLDADDEWLPEKLGLQVAYFDRYPQTGLVHTATVGGLDRPRGSGTPLYAPPQQMFSTIFHVDTVVQTLTVMAPRAVLLEAGGFDERREIHVEDWDLWLRIAARYPVGYLPRPLAMHRRGGHMSTAFEKTFAGQALVMEKHRELCSTACAIHRGDPDSCLRERRHLLYHSLGYERFCSNDREGATRAFARAISEKPWSVSSYLRYASCFIPESWIAVGRSVRGAFIRRFGRTPAPYPRVTRGPRLTIAQDTIYRRGRHRVARVIHGADGAFTRATRSRRRVLFEAASPMSFGLFRPIYRRLVSDPRIEFWFTAPGRAWEPETIFSAVGIRDRVIPSSEASWKKWDLCVNTDFFEMTNLRRRTRRIHLFHGVAGKYGLDAPVDFAREIATYACLMFPNEDRLRRYVRAGLVPADGRTAALVGYPKLDALLDGSLDRDALCAGLRLSRPRPVVLYAPTWSPHSSLNRMGEAIIDGLAGAGYQVLVKLHDRSYDRMPRASGGVDWAQRLQAYAAHPSVRVVREADATPFLYVADAIVTDHSSIGFEFMVLDRPLVIVDCPDLLEHSQVNPEKVAQLRAGADVAGSPREVPEAVSAALSDPTRHSQVRRRTADAMFYRVGTATDRAVSLLYELLEVPAPATQEYAEPERIFVSATSA